MARYTKTQITQLSANEQAALNAINKNFEDLEAAIQDTVSRSGNTPTHMTNDLDMNGKRLINVPAPRTGTDLVRQQDVVGDIETVQQLVNTTTNAAAQTLKAAQDVQEIIEDTHIGIVADDLALGDDSKIKKDADNIEDITTVADNISAINTANSNITNIDKVADDISNVNTAATNISDINTCASNMSAIQDAPTQASNAANSATAAAGSASAAATAASTMRLSLFDFKWTDYEQADQSWLRADTFSWQDGTVYSNAYQHLVDDVTNGTSQTETISGHTITYTLADDGHKIVSDANASEVEGLYSDTGVAWYYILDLVNHRFKLPRELPITDKSKGNKYPLGISTNETAGSAYAWTNRYSSAGTQHSIYYSNYPSSPMPQTGSPDGISTDGRMLGITTDPTKSGIISHRANENGQQYLYFYVGQFSQSATEQTAGLNAELFNGKVDLNAANLSTAGKSLISGLGMPSTTYDSLTVLASGQDYTAPANGWFSCIASGNTVNSYLHIINNSSGTEAISQQQGRLCVLLPATKGETVKLNYSGVSTWVGFNFIYAEGEPNV